MGAKQSKTEFARNGPARQSQKKQFQTIKQKIGDASKALKKFKGAKQTDEACAGVEAKVQEVRDMLQGLSAELKTKHQVLYDDCVSKCEGILKAVGELRITEEVTVEPPVGVPEILKTVDLVDAPVSYDEAVITEEKAIEEDVPESTELQPPESNDQQNNQPNSQKTNEQQINANTIEKKTKKLRKSKQALYKRQISLEEDSFNKIHKVREEMVDLRDEVLVFKGEPNGQLYHFLKETFWRLIRKLEAIETYDHKQIKYERRIAIDYANESIAALEQIASGAKPSTVRQSLTQQEQLKLLEHFQRRPSTPDPPKILDEAEEAKDTDNEVANTSDDSAAEPVNMRDFKQMLDVKLGRMSRMNVITVNMIKKNKEPSKDNVGETDGSAGNLTTDDSSADDIDDILYSLEGSTDNMTNKCMVTPI